MIKVPLSQKKSLVLTLASLLSREEFKKNKLILVTASGIIAGVPVLKPNKDNNNPIFELIIEASKKLYNDKDMSEIIEKVDLGNDGYILLKDVSILNNNLCPKLHELAVFFDQIIAATIGDIGQ